MSHEIFLCTWNSDLIGLSVLLFAKSDYPTNIYLLCLTTKAVCLGFFFHFLLTHTKMSWKSSFSLYTGIFLDLSGTYPMSPRRFEMVLLAFESLDWTQRGPFYAMLANRKQSCSQLSLSNLNKRVLKKLCTCLPILLISLCGHHQMYLHFIFKINLNIAYM